MLAAAGRANPVALLTTQNRLRKLVGDADAAALTSGLTVDGDVLASLGPVVGLARLERGEIDGATYAERYGHRGPHEFRAVAAAPGRAPGWVAEQLAAQRAAGTDPLAMLEKVEAANRAAWTGWWPRTTPRRERAVRDRLERWARAERGREQARTEVVRIFTVVRALLLRAGELTGLGDEVFMLSLDEVEAVLRGGPARTRRAPGRVRAVPDPAALPGADPRRVRPVRLGGRPGPALRPVRRDGHRRAGRRPRYTGLPRGERGGGGDGPGCCAAPTRGRRLLAGEVLVTTVTNIGWTPLFPRAAAVVTDVGAPLSHAANRGPRAGHPRRSSGAAPRPRSCAPATGCGWTAAGARSRSSPPRRGRPQGAGG
jgi:pyruvate,water dikinase